MTHENKECVFESKIKTKARNDHSNWHKGNTKKLWLRYTKWTDYDNNMVWREEDDAPPLSENTRSVVDWVRQFGRSEGGLATSSSAERPGPSKYRWAMPGYTPVQGDVSDSELWTDRETELDPVTRAATARGSRTVRHTDADPPRPCDQPHPRLARPKQHHSFREKRKTGHHCCP